MRLKEEIIEEFKNNSSLRLELQVELGNVSESTVRRKLRENHPDLTQMSILKFMALRLGENNIENLLENQ